jgi:hypothetical protein
MRRASCVKACRRAGRSRPLQRPRVVTYTCLAPHATSPTARLRGVVWWREVCQSVRGRLPPAAWWAKSWPSCGDASGAQPAGAGAGGA